MNMEGTNEQALTAPAQNKKALTVVQEVSELRRVVKLEQERRKILRAYVKDNLIEDVDYGSIEGESRGGRKFRSKPGLFKPGAEKICSLFHLTPRFEKDQDSWVMFGAKAGVVCFICRLFNKQGESVGEGRGVSTMQETGATENKVVKIAQKRAQVDAVIRFAALSDIFSQDMETVGSNELAQETGNQLPKHMPRVYMANEAQLTRIGSLLNAKGKDKNVLLSHYKIGSLTQLTFKQAEAAIVKLTTYPDVSQEIANTPTTKGPEKEKVPAANYQIAWVRSHKEQLMKHNIIDPTMKDEMFDFIHAAEFTEIKRRYDEIYANKSL